jgi:hypothetical protein
MLTLLLKLGDAALQLPVLHVLLDGSQVEGNVLIDDALQNRLQ